MSGAAKNHDAELKHIEEVSKNARTTWFGMLGVLVFGAIAVAGVKDRDFFTYGVETALPLVGVTVPTVPFFYAAPILILAIYIYLHLYLLKLWRGLAALPATVTVAGERKPLDDVVYPWLLSDAAIYSKPGARKRTLGWLTRLVSLMLGWVAGPVVLGLFWVRSWPNHDPVLTLYLAGLTLAAVCIGTFTFFRARRELRGGPRTWRIVLGWLCAAVIVLTATGALPFYSWMKTVGNIPGLVIAPFWRADLYPANLYQAEIVARPENWLPRGEAEEVFLAEYGAVDRGTLDALLAAERDGTDPPEGESFDWLDAARGAFKEQRRNLLFSFDKLDLSGRDLRRANLRDAFLPGVRLVGARLGGADMSGAQMEGVVFSEKVNDKWIVADLAGALCTPGFSNLIPPARTALGCTLLENAHLEGATLRGADLSHSLLNGVNFSGADLRSVNLSNAALSEANLSGGNLRGADLSHAYLVGADLSGAHLNSVDLSGTELTGANLRYADLFGTDLSGAGLDRADLSGAVLNGANLRFAGLVGANLSGTDLRRANLSEVDLSDLRGAGGLRLAGAIGDDKTRLPARWPTPHVVATCYDAIHWSIIYSMAKSWHIDEATFRARYVCPEGMPPGRIEGPLGAPPDRIEGTVRPGR